MGGVRNGIEGDAVGDHESLSGQQHPQEHIRRFVIRTQYETNRRVKGLDDPAASRMQESGVGTSCDGIYISAIDFPAVAAKVKVIAVHFGGVTASTEVIAVKRHTGVHASVIVCKNTIANQTLAYAA